MRFFIYILFPLNLFGQVTYVDDIQPILAIHCTTCHQTNNIGPMALDNYESVAAFASMLEYVTTEKLMPPWRADHNYSNLKITQPLSATEKATIKQWIADGLWEKKLASRSVDNSLARSQSHFCFDESHHRAQNNGQVVRSIFSQKSFSPDQPFIHTGDYTNRQQVFVIPSNLTEDLFVDKIMFEPGDASIVLSANIYLDQSDRGLVLDKKDPKSGYTNLGGIGFRTTHSVWHQWCPDDPQEAFENFVKRIPAGSNFILQIQYRPSAITKKDLSKFTIYYSEEKTGRPELTSEYLVKSDLLTSPFFIPKNSQQNCRAVYSFEEEVSITALMPYGHFICSGWEIFIHHKNGNTTPLLKIDDWRLMWKRQYQLNNPVHVEPGDQLIAIAKYNNTAENLDIPILPTKVVQEGEGRYNEQFLVGVDYIKLQP